jgi:hypothetical protein
MKKSYDQLLEAIASQTVVIADETGHKENEVRSP